MLVHHATELASSSGQHRILPGSHWRLTIEHPTDASPGYARTWALDTLATVDCGKDAADAVELAVSELATNAVRYAPGPAELLLALATGSVEVACIDAHPETAGAVHPREDAAADADAFSGRGLLILAALALDGVQVDTLVGRKRVRVRLPIGETS